MPLLLISSLLLPFNSSAWAKEQIIDSDVAYFRIENDIYMQSDLKDIVADLNDFRCIYPDSLLLRKINFGDDRKIQIKLPPKNEKSRRYQKLLTLLKVMQFAKKQNVIMRPEVLDLMRQAAMSNRCMQVAKVRQGLQNLMQAEIYFRTRFKKNANNLAPDEFLSYKKQSPHLSDREIIKKAKSAKLDQDIEQFLSGINNQVIHTRL